MNPAEYRIMAGAEDLHWWYRSLRELILHFVRLEFQRKGPLEILDAGCGTGGLLATLAPFGHATGCDVSQDALSFCRRRGIEAVFAADLNGFNPRREACDIITIIDVLYHDWIKDRRAVLAQCFAALKPGGVLIANDPAFELLRGTHDIAVHTGKRFRRPEYRALFEDAGFRVERATCRLMPLFLPIWLARAASRCLRHKQDRAEVESDVRMPPPLVNSALLLTARLENAILRHIELPLGTSVFVVARKPA